MVGVGGEAAHRFAFTGHPVNGDRVPASRGIPVLLCLATSPRKRPQSNASVVTIWDIRCTATLSSEPLLRLLPPEPGHTRQQPAGLSSVSHHPHIRLLSRVARVPKHVQHVQNGLLTAYTGESIRLKDRSTEPAICESGTTLINEHKFFASFFDSLGCVSFVEDISSILG